MIQEMMGGYATNLFVGYVKGGIVGWAVWFIAAVGYMLWSFGLDPAMYRDGDEEKGGRKWTLRGILIIILWPWGIMYGTHEVVKFVDKKMIEKENRYRRR